MRLNPFAPGAGTPPPELAGRDEILLKAEDMYVRAQNGYPSRSMLLLGLRGVGKTVLLTEIARRARDQGVAVARMEAFEECELADLLYPEMRRVLRSLSGVEKAKNFAANGLRALRNFAATFRLKFSDVEISVEPELGIADSGDLKYDLPDMFEAIGLAAEKGKAAWLLLIDEIQYLREKDFAALIGAMHRMAQEGLPVLLIGAGLPQTARLAGDAKSYAERMFLYPTIGKLTRGAVGEAVEKPLAKFGVQVSLQAMDAIAEKTQGYPFFVQALAFQAARLTEGNVMTLTEVEKAYPLTLEELDEGFFRVRFDRMTKAQVVFVKAAASLGNGPYLLKDIAATMKKNPASLSSVRSQLIRNGIIFSPKTGMIAFTVPLFASFVSRRI